jgi:hypothetical protein
MKFSRKKYSSSLFGKLKEILVQIPLRHYATSRKVAGSRPDEVNFFSSPNPSGRTRPWGLLSLQQKWVPEAEK